MIDLVELSNLFSWVLWSRLTRCYFLIMSFRLVQILREFRVWYHDFFVNFVRILRKTGRYKVSEVFLVSSNVNFHTVSECGLFSCFFSSISLTRLVFFRWWSILIPLFEALLSEISSRDFSLIWVYIRRRLSGPMIQLIITTFVAIGFREC